MLVFFGLYFCGLYSGIQKKIERNLLPKDIRELVSQTQTTAQALFRLDLYRALKSQGFPDNEAAELVRKLTTDSQSGVHQPGLPGVKRDPVRGTVRQRINSFINLHKQVFSRKFSPRVGGFMLCYNVPAVDLHGTGRTFVVSSQQIGSLKPAISAESKYFVSFHADLLLCC